MDSKSTSEHVFLSYSHKDAQMMYRIRSELERLGITVWTDEGLIPGTQSWKTTIEANIRDALGVIVILSPHANQSIWVERELEYASVHGKRIFPVLVQGEPSEAIPIELINAQWIDVRNQASLSPQIQKLVIALRGKPGAGRGGQAHQAPRHPPPRPGISQPAKAFAILPVVLIGACLIAAVSLSILFVPRILESLNNRTLPPDVFPSDIPAPEDSDPTDPSPSGGTGCIVTITNPFAPLMSDPDPVSQQLVQIPSGDYSTLDYTLETFAGREQGWFKIEVEGRIGWVEDNIIFIDDKTSACP